MHVVILNQTFHPDVAATGQLMWDVARHLQQSGNRVTALTSRGFYGTQQLHPSKRERLDGIEIIRVGGTALGKKSLPARLADFASFYAAAALQLSRIQQPDVVLALTSPPLVATLAMLHKQFRSPLKPPTKFVYHIMDLYPDAAMAMEVIDHSSPTGRLLRRMTCRTLDTADAVIALGRDMKERLQAVYHGHVRPERICIIPPWADGTNLHPLAKSQSQLAARNNLADTFNIVYSGNLGMAHDLSTITAAIDATRRDETLRWVFVGAGKRMDQLREEAQQSHWPHVVFLPFQDRDQLNDSLNMADIHLVSQLPAFTGIVVPSKLAGILAVGRPTLMVGPADSECSRIISENAAGFVIPNGNPGLLLARIKLLREDEKARTEMGHRASAAFLATYDRPVACRRIEAVLHAVTDPDSNKKPSDC
ncbi:MAG: glycosyltransferase family 4 protein [Planctomycetota bacterium]|nr:glycosyltransferase family 4 protein [Planctomycetota bacterium]